MGRCVASVLRIYTKRLQNTLYKKRGLRSTKGGTRSRLGPLNEQWEILHARVKPSLKNDETLRQINQLETQL